MKQERRNDQCRLSFVGKFEITRKAICADPDAVHAILAQGIIVDCQANFYNDSLVYVMFAPGLFREVHEGEQVPIYEISVTEMVDANDFFVFFHVEADEI